MTEGQQFVITREQLRDVVERQYLVWHKTGYATWEYWRNAEPGLAFLGEALQELFLEADPALFEEVWSLTEGEAVDE